MAKTSLKVGDKVMYRGTFGRGVAKETTIESIELCEDEHEKYGEMVDEMTKADYERCCVSLADGHWCYGYQIMWNASIELNEK